MTFAAVRGAVSAAVAAIAVLLLLLAITFAALGDAGSGWDDGGRKATVVIALLIVGCLAAGVGGAVGTWQAAIGGADSVRAAVLSGAAGPALGTLLVTVLQAHATAGGLVLAVIELLLFAVAALGGAVLIGRRLE